MSNLFRKASLEKLSSPEQLDLLMKVTTPKGWLSLLAICMLLLCAILWGIFGSIPERVIGKGMLIKTGGALEIKLPSSGEIIDVRLVAGDIVKKGDVIARIDQSELLGQIINTKKKIEELLQERNKIIDYAGKGVKLSGEYEKGQRDNIRLSIANAKESLKFLQEKIQTQQKLFEQGLITRQNVLNTKEQINSTNKEIATLENQLNQISVQNLDQKKQDELELSRVDQNISDTRRQLTDLQGKFEVNSRVISPYSGRVLEVKLKEGDIAARGESIISLELMGKEIKNLETVVYVPVAEGKKIRPGMEIQISPSTVKKEEYGCLIGKVTSVSEFPASYEGMMRILGNEKLVQTLTGNNASIEVFADLVPDETTESGYKWTSPEGPPSKVFSGTMCDTTITTVKKRPISLVIPLLKSYAGL